MRIPYYGNETKAVIVQRIADAIRPSIGDLGVHKFKDYCATHTLKEIRAFSEQRFGIVFYNDLDSVKRKARDAIEQAAIRCDHRIFDTGGNSNVIFEQKKEELVAWNAAGRPDDITDYKYLRIEQRALEILHNQTITPLQAAQSIKQKLDKWDNEIAYYREYYRLVGKAKVEVATGYDEVKRTAEEFIKKLDELN